MRKNESNKVSEALQKFDLKLHIVDASKQFYDATTRIKILKKSNIDNLEPEFYESLPLNQVIYFV